MEVRTWPLAATILLTSWLPVHSSHGSHTLGLLGSDDPRILGVAPESHLRSYAPFSCLDEIKSPTVAQADAVVLEAVIKAAADGCDVINASIGADRWPSEPVAIAALVPKQCQSSGQRRVAYECISDHCPSL